MKEIAEAHRQAMDLAEQAESVRIHGDEKRSRELALRAFEQERLAAASVQDQVGLEPTRSVLHRSAASLALECGELREAERLLAVGLSGNPPEEIADEMRDLLEQVYFERHLSLRGIRLEKDEFQVSMTGEAVGCGMAETDAVLDRLVQLQKLLYRTAERKMKRPFREHGAIGKEMRNELESYLSTPRAASFAVSLRVGRKEQPALPSMDLAEEVIGEFIDCIDLYSQGKFEDLETRIPDKSYYDNFIGLVRAISPDGKKIRAIGFTALQPQGERKVILAKPVVGGTRRTGERPSPQVEVRGTLRVADARHEEKGSITVIDSLGVEHHVRVPLGKMDDIVRPMFDYEVLVTGKRKGKMIMLEDIQRLE